jgi:hypothetical protein
MRRFASTTVYSLFLGALLLVSFEGLAHAYADPGTGLLIFQAASSTFAVLCVYFRKSLFGRWRADKDSPADKPKEETAPKS